MAGEDAVKGLSAYKTYNLIGLLICLAIPIVACFAGYCFRLHGATAELKMFCRSSGVFTLSLLSLFWVYSAHMQTVFKEDGLPRLSAMTYTILGFWQPMIWMFSPTSIIDIPILAIVSLCLTIPFFWFSLRFGQEYVFGREIDPSLDSIYKTFMYLWVPGIILAILFSPHWMNMGF